MNILQFTGDEIVSDILLKMPESMDILLSHGLSCASCHLNIHETLRDGMRQHRYGEKELAIILNDLNEAATELKIPPEGRIVHPPKLTKKAADKVVEFQTESDQKGFGFKIEVIPDTIGSAEYFLDFMEQPEPGDKVVTTNNVKLFLDKDSYVFLQNCTIDYLVDTATNEEGFKVNKNN